MASPIDMAIICAMGQTVGLDLHQPTNWRMDEDGQTTIENGNGTGHLLIPRILQSDEVTITHRPIFFLF